MEPKQNKSSDPHDSSGASSYWVYEPGEEPERPSGLPECEASDPSDPITCDPSIEIDRREREVAAAQADIANRNKALDALKAKSEQLTQALGAHEQGAAEREQRLKACQEFVDCKRPDLPADDCSCVEKAIWDYDDLIDQYEEYIRFCIWKLGQASAATEAAAREQLKAEERFAWVRSQATECLALCETMREKFDNADAEDERCQMYLYWRLAADMLSSASETCTTPADYQDYLCRAFDDLCAATDAADAARTYEGELQASKESVIHEYTTLKSNRIATIAEQVSKCCCKHDADPYKPTEAPAAQNAGPDGAG